jgi:stage V sporulation protein AE
MNDYIMTFLVGGIICLLHKYLWIETKLTPGRILVLFVTTGVILGALNIYDPIVKYGKQVATIPLTGFGFNLVNRL